MALEAAAEIGNRFAAKARELANEEEDAGRKTELLKIAEVCDRVPADPARTFYGSSISCMPWIMSMLRAWARGGPINIFILTTKEISRKDG